jgi:hypothetical protein
MDKKGEKRATPDTRCGDEPGSKRLAPGNNVHLRHALWAIVSEATDTQALDALKENGSFPPDDPWWLQISTDGVPSLANLVYRRPENLKWVLAHINSNWSAAHMSSVVAAAVDSNNPELARHVAAIFPGAVSPQLYTRIAWDMTRLRRLVSVIPPTPDIAWGVLHGFLRNTPGSSPCVWDRLWEVMHPYVDWPHCPHAELLDYTTRLCDAGYWSSDAVGVAFRSVGCVLGAHTLDKIFGAESIASRVIPHLYAAGYTPRSPELLAAAARRLAWFLSAGGDDWMLGALVVLRRHGIHVTVHAPPPGAKWRRGAAKKYERVMAEVDAARRAFVAEIPCALPVEIAELVGDYHTLRPLAD